jgi:hypothetical protein
MPIHRMSDPEYWENPPSLATVAHQANQGLKFAGTTFFVMGDVDSDPQSATTPVAMVLRLGPGQVIVHHAHDCERLEIVVQGSIDVGDGGVLKPGDIMTAKPMEFYGPHVAGPEGCTTLEVFSNMHGCHEVSYKTVDGNVTVVHYNEGELRPADVAFMEGVPEKVEAVLAAAAASAASD